MLPGPNFFLSTSQSCFLYGTSPSADFSQPRCPQMLQSDNLTAPSQQEERFYPPIAQAGPEMSHYTKFNHVQSPEPVTGQICSLFDCQGLGHGPASGARGEVLLPGCRA